MYDIVIRGARVVDGSGGPFYCTDVAVENGMIKKIGSVCGKAEIVIEAGESVLAPGFIDMHSHSDFTIPANPHAESKVIQGVTTEVVGNCGISPAPVREGHVEELKEYTGFLGGGNLRWKWRTFEEWLTHLDILGSLTNLVPLVGHGTLRIATTGFKDCSPTSSEMEAMRQLLLESLRVGAFGMSTGLIYPPGCFADTEELIKLATIVADYGGIYASHIRGESHNLLRAFEEAIEIGRKAQLPVEISHHKAAGRSNWGKVNHTLAMIESAQSNGIDVTSDLYPYTAGSGGLSMLLPNWVHEGGVKGLIWRLRDPTSRLRIRQDFEENRLDRWNPINETNGWSDIIISDVQSERNKCFEGKSLAEIAEEKAKDPFDVMLDLLLYENASVRMILCHMCEDDVVTIMRHPTSMIGSDGGALSRQGILAKGKPHPRSYGTFPRVLGHYVREKEVLALSEAVMKMTFVPAQKLGLKNRGVIQEGLVADLVLFDPAEISDLATYEAPLRSPRGISCVIVNGEVVVKGGRLTGSVSGKILRKTGKVK
jgi:N-acyl-D-amino-acid deacylase